MFDNQYFRESLSTIVTLGVFLALGILIRHFIRAYARKGSLSERRTNLIVKYVNILLTALLAVIIFGIWQINPSDLFAFFTGTLTVIGVAFFAQWSILSNITSGVILFFTFPFRIGDFIRVHDKDFPLEAQIEDIKAFHTILKTRDGELVTYPNSLLLQKGVSIVPVKPEEKDFFD
jgi:small-conductance mechanosensitive channel